MQCFTKHCIIIYQDSKYNIDIVIFGHFFNAISIIIIIKYIIIVELRYRICFLPKMKVKCKIYKHNPRNTKTSVIRVRLIPFSRKYTKIFFFQKEMS